MSRTTITSSQTDSGSPLDPTLMDALRGNDSDHEDRLLALEALGDIRVFSHFVNNGQYSSDQVANNSIIRDYLGQFIVESNSANCTIKEPTGTVADDKHYLNIDMSN